MQLSELNFTSDIAQTLKTICLERNIKEAIVIVDENTEKACLPLLQNVSPVICIPAGESSKTLQTLELVLNGLLTNKADRNTVIINLGGGVVSDIGGFAASIYKRGLRYINIPTSLLGMVDASIGGKTAVDFHNYKNYIGAFYAPELVLISLQFLDTLPEEELESAWAEIIKSAVIGSIDIFNMIESGKDLKEVVMQTALFKQGICDQDPRDTGVRQLLNFGHTIGHAFESYRLSIGHPVLHGTAVARGMLYETGLALSLGLISEANAKKICMLIRNRMKCEELNDSELSGLKQYLAGDKKNSDGYVVFSLPVAIGKGSYGVKMAIADLKF